MALVELNLAAKKTVIAAAMPIHPEEAQPNIPTPELVWHPGMVTLEIGKRYRTLGGDECVVESINAAGTTARVRILPMGIARFHRLDGKYDGAAFSDGFHKHIVQPDHPMWQFERVWWAGGKLEWAYKEHPDKWHTFGPVFEPLMGDDEYGIFKCGRKRLRLDGTTAYLWRVKPD